MHSRVLAFSPPPLHTHTETERQRERERIREEERTNEIKKNRAEQNE